MAPPKLTPRRSRGRTSSAEDTNNSENDLPPSSGHNDTLKRSNSDKLESLDEKYDDNLPDISADPSKEEKASSSTASCVPEKHRRKVEKQWHHVQHRVHQLPGGKKMMDLINMCPPRVRIFFLTLWLLWKVVLVVMFIHGLRMASNVISDVASSSASQDSASGSSSSALDRFTLELPDFSGFNSGDAVAATVTDANTPRILYVVTTLAEFNSGQRQTEKGQDRLGEVLIPIMVDSVESMVHEPFNYHVDVFLITAYTLKPEREAYIRSRLPNGVGLEIWDDACPLGYEAKHSPNQLIDNTRALARQHRYVIKDKLPYYDLFVAFEDDMRITGDHVTHYMKMSKEIEKLRLEAPDSVPGHAPVDLDPKKMPFHGALTKAQLDRVVPGFIRVEVLLDEKENGAQTKLDNIDTDFNFEFIDQDKEVKTKEVHFNSRICCDVQMKPNKNTPVHPKPQDVVIWETNVKALSILNMPKPKIGKPSKLLDWVAALPGPGKRLPDTTKMGGYWSGREGAFGDEEKPSGGRPDIIAQQGGWMATRAQILRMNNDDICMGSFVPPFDPPMYRKDGQESFNVEFWSGGYQFFTGVRGGCNMQRIISVHPDYFGNHFLYHVANNKQRQLSQERMLRADNLFAQLNTVRKTAEKALIKETGAGR